MSLTSWRNSDWLTDHQTSPEEIADLLDAPDRDLTDCTAATSHP